MKYFAVPLFAVFLAACASEDETIPIDKSGAMVLPKLVGRVATVPSDRRFVLIQSYGTWNVPAGTVLTTRGTGDKTANLVVTGEAMGQYAAADLQSGEVSVGDAVYSRNFAANNPVTPTPPATPETPTTTSP